MIEKAYGKINLSIDVVGKMANGYHQLDMIMLPIDLYDVIDIEISQQDYYECNEDLPYNQKNIIYKCVELLRNIYGFEHRFSIKVQKNIPSQAGLAGGSADGAATLRILNKLLNLNLTIEKLADLGKQIGADIPFCVYSTPARVQGIGEIIRPINLTREIDVLLIKPDQGVNTGLAFKNLNFEKCEHPNMDELEKQFLNNQPFAHLLGNSLQYSAFDLAPKVKEIIETCKQSGYENTLMTGSGSTVFVIDDKFRLEQLEKRLKEKYDFVFLTKIFSPISFE